VKVPEKLVAVVAPVIVPFALNGPLTTHAPETELSVWARSIAKVPTVELPACVD
jgi:hypothetical protein